MPVDFGFFDPKSEDFHGMRALLARSGALLPAGSPFDVGGLADVLAEQAAVGSIVKVIGEGSEEPSDDEVLGFMSAISLHAHRTARFAGELRESFLRRCVDTRARERLAGLLESPKTGLLLSERLVNLPAALLPSLVDSLLQDIAWAVEHAEDADERRSFNFDTLVLVAPVTLASNTGNTSSAADAEADAAHEKKKKKRKAVAAEAHASLLENVVFDRVDEEILAGAAGWATLLNSAGRRQLLMTLSLEQVRGAIPALHAAMGES
jgi:hypothetical protein